MSAAEAIRLVQSAEQALGAGDKDEAISQLREAVQNDPQFYPALRYLGMLLSTTGQFEEAMSFCERAVRLNPNDIEGIAFLANCYMRQFRLAEATQYYKRAISLNARVALFHENLGLCLLHQAMDQAAEPEFRQAVALDPAHTMMSYSGLSQILQGRGDLAGAAGYCRQAAALAPGTGLGEFHLGEADLYEGKIESSVDHFKRAIELQPNLDTAYRLLGGTLQQLGQFEEAETYLKKAIELAPKRGSSYTAITLGRKMTEVDRPFLGSMRGTLAHGGLMVSDECAIHFAVAKTLNDLADYGPAMEEYDKANALAARVMLQGNRFNPQMLKNIYEQAATVFTKEFFAEHAKLGSESEMPIFILGMMRSGTTLVEQIVSSHPDVGAGGELLFWTGEQLDILNRSGRLDEARLREVQKEYLELLRRVAPGKPRVTNKTPGNYNHLGLIHLAFPRAKIIHCKRDPVDTALSIWMTPNAAPNVFGYVRKNIVFAYKEYRRLMKLYKSVLPEDSILEVQYEDLIADHEGVTRGIISFLGLEWDDACLRHEENTRTVSTPTVWQARQPIYTGAVQRWKKYEKWLGAFGELEQ